MMHCASIRGLRCLGDRAGLSKGRKWEALHGGRAAGATADYPERSHAGMAVLVGLRSGVGVCLHRRSLGSLSGARPTCMLGKRMGGAARGEARVAVDGPFPQRALLVCALKSNASWYMA